MYRELNPDLINMSDFEAKLHYINHGINEWRREEKSKMGKS
jgi:hypothetical protein